MKVIVFTINLPCSYFSDKKEAKRLMLLVKEEYNLDSLRVDNSVSYEQVIHCCNNLLISRSSMKYSLCNLRMCIAPFFSVMNDGEMYILWNWVSETWSKLKYVFFPIWLWSALKFEFCYCINFEMCRDSLFLFAFLWYALQLCKKYQFVVKLILRHCNRH